MEVIGRMAAGIAHEFNNLLRSFRVTWVCCNRPGRNTIDRNALLINHAGQPALPGVYPSLLGSTANSVQPRVLSFRRSCADEKNVKPYHRENLNQGSLRE